jgi:hypothetical protein
MPQLIDQMCDRVILLSISAKSFYFRFWLDQKTRLKLGMKAVLAKGLSEKFNHNTGFLNILVGSTINLDLNHCLTFSYSVDWLGSSNFEIEIANCHGHIPHKSLLERVAKVFEEGTWNDPHRDIIPWKPYSQYWTDSQVRVSIQFIKGDENSDGLIVWLPEIPEASYGDNTEDLNITDLMDFDIEEKREEKRDAIRPCLGKQMPLVNQPDYNHRFSIAPDLEQRDPNLEKDVNDRLKMHFLGTVNFLKKVNGYQELNVDLNNFDVSEQLDQVFQDEMCEFHIIDTDFFDDLKIFYVTNNDNESEESDNTEFSMERGLGTFSAMVQTLKFSLKKNCISNEIDLEFDMPNTCFYFAPNLGFIIGVIKNAQRALGIDKTVTSSQNISSNTRKIDEREIRLILTGYGSSVDRGRLYGNEDVLEKAVANKLQAWVISEFMHYTKDEKEMHLVFVASSTEKKMAPTVEAVIETLRIGGFYPEVDIREGNVLKKIKSEGSLFVNVEVVDQILGKVDERGKGLTLFKCQLTLNVVADEPMEPWGCAFGLTGSVSMNNINSQDSMEPPLLEKMEFEAKIYLGMLGSMKLNFKTNDYLNLNMSPSLVRNCMRAKSGLNLVPGHRNCYRQLRKRRPCKFRIINLLGRTIFFSGKNTVDGTMKIEEYERLKKKKNMELRFELPERQRHIFLKIDKQESSKRRKVLVKSGMQCFVVAQTIVFVTVKIEEDETQVIVHSPIEIKNATQLPIILGFTKEENCSTLVKPGTSYYLPVAEFSDLRKIAVKWFPQHEPKSVNQGRSVQNLTARNSYELLGKVDEPSSSDFKFTAKKINLVGSKRKNCSPLSKVHYLVSGGRRRISGDQTSYVQEFEHLESKKSIHIRVAFVQNDLEMINITFYPPCQIINSCCEPIRFKIEKDGISDCSEAVRHRVAKLHPGQKFHVFCDPLERPKVYFGLVEGFNQPKKYWEFLSSEENTAWSREIFFDDKNMFRATKPFTIVELERKASAVNLSYTCAMNVKRERVTESDIVSLRLYYKYWIVNYTDYNLNIKEKEKGRNNRFIRIPPSEKDNPIPVMFGMKSSSNKDVQLGLSLSTLKGQQSEWEEQEMYHSTVAIEETKEDPIELEALSFLPLEKERCKSQKGLKGLYPFSLSVNEVGMQEFPSTSVLTFRPGIVIHNKLDFVIYLRQKDAKDKELYFELPPGEMLTKFHWIDKTCAKEVSFSVDSDREIWSQSFELGFGERYIWISDLLHSPKIGDCRKSSVAGWLQLTGTRGAESGTFLNVTFSPGDLTFPPCRVQNRTPFTFNIRPRIAKVQLKPRYQLLPFSNFPWVHDVTPSKYKDDTTVKSKDIKLVFELIDQKTSIKLMEKIYELSSVKPVKAKFNAIKALRSSIPAANVVLNGIGKDKFISIDIFKFHDGPTTNILIQQRILLEVKEFAHNRMLNGTYEITTLPPKNGRAIYQRKKSAEIYILSWDLVFGQPAWVFTRRNEEIMSYTRSHVMEPTELGTEQIWRTNITPNGNSEEWKYETGIKVDETGPLDTPTELRLKVLENEINYLKTKYSDR